MRKLIALLLCVQLSSVFAANSILALVNGSIITTASVEQQLSGVRSFDEKMALINKQIDIQLQLDFAKSKGIIPIQALIDDNLKIQAQIYQITLKELMEHPQFPDLLSNLKNQLTLLLLQKQVTQGMTISLDDKEIKDSCQNNTAENSTRQIRVAQIIISKVEGAKDQEAAVKELLNKLAKHIEKGASFYDFAKLHSQDPSYAQGGLTDWITIEGPNLAFFDNLKEGEVSEVYNSDSGWAIAIKADERYIDSNLEICKQQLINKKATQYYLDWVQGLRDSAYIEIFSEKL